MDLASNHLNVTTQVRSEIADESIEQSLGLDEEERSRETLVDVAVQEDATAGLHNLKIGVGNTLLAREVQQEGEAYELATPGPVPPEDSILYRHQPEWSEPETSVPAAEKDTFTELFPWSSRTAQEWLSLDPDVEKAAQQAAWLIFCAARRSNVTKNWHDPVLLKAWDLDTAYDLFFAKQPEKLEALLQESGLRHSLTGLDERRADREAIVLDLENSLNDPNMTPFLIRMRQLRVTPPGNEGTIEVRRKPRPLYAIAADDLGLNSTDATLAKQRYHEVIAVLQHRLHGTLKADRQYQRLRHGETVEDIEQKRLSQLVEGVIRFPYWESWHINPDLMVDRLVPFLLSYLPGYQKNTDALLLTSLLGQDNQGGDRTMDVFAAAESLDPAEIATSRVDYEALQREIASVVHDLKLDARTPQLLLALAEDKPIRQIADEFNMSINKVTSTIAKLRQELAQRLDPERTFTLKQRGAVSAVWGNLLDETQSRHIEEMLRKRTLTPFFTSALSLALEIAKQIRDKHEPNLNVREARKEIVDYVYAGLRQSYPNMQSDNQDTARRAIQRAFGMLDGREAMQQQATGRCAYRNRSAERDEWLTFIAHHPEWEAEFGEFYQAIIRAYYLSTKSTEAGEGFFSQMEIAKQLSVHSSSISRALDVINKKRLLMIERP